MKLSLNKKVSSLILVILIFSNSINITFFNLNNVQIEEKDAPSLFTSQPNITQFELPPIDYASLNNSWYNHKIEMLIITPDDQQFVDAITPLMEWKNDKGVKTIILRNFSLYSGADNAEKIRNMIISYYNKENIKWVLLAGDAEDTIIPIRYVYNPDVIVVGGSETVGDDYYKPTDFYYADLDGTWDDDNDGDYGESKVYNSNGIDEIDWDPEVYVGRFPANDANELEIMVNKSLKYETNPFIGIWMNKMLLAGATLDDNPPEDEARLTEYIWKNFVLSEMNFTHLHLTNPSFTPETPPLPNQENNYNRTNFVNEIDSGYSTITFAAHGSPSSVVDGGPGATVLYLNSDASTQSNLNMPSLFYGSACTTSSYDILSDNNIGESLITSIDTGAIGYIGALRVTWYFEGDTSLQKLNRANARLFWKAFFEDKKFQQGKALYDSKVDYLNDYYHKYGGGSMDQEWERKNLLTYCLLGDPELDVYTNIPRNASNPLPQNIFEGAILNIPIKNVKNELIPYARVHLRTSDGKYNTFYANKQGYCRIELPLQIGEKYNVTITGHNLIPSYFNFTTIEDTEDPKINSINIDPEEPTDEDKITFTVNAEDNSGIDNVFLIITDNDFIEGSYTIYTMSETSQSNNDFEYKISSLEKGDYSYLVIARDRKNHTVMLYDDSFTFEVVEAPEDEEDEENGNNFLFLLAIIGIPATGIIILVIVIIYKKKSAD
ncbi:MAG: C25 family cysteine peptidase [Promethearchaeota archaeon]